MFGFFNLVEILDTREDQSKKIYYLEEQLREARELLEGIVCTKEPDKGVILVDHESQTYWCHERRAWVYKHENFSQLGDALIELHEKLQKRDTP
jgi:hypothetical protein